MDICLDEQFYVTLLWLLIITLIIIIVTIVIFNVIRQFVLFQPTRDQKWFPRKDDESSKVTNSDVSMINNELSSISKRDYTQGFTNSYLIIGNRKYKAFTKAQITKVSQSRMFNIGDLHYINIWKFEQFPGNRIVLYFHGNNDNISYRKYVVDICHTLRLNLVLVDYRGYGDSSALPDSKYLLQDAKTVYQHLRQTYAAHQVIIWGESLGGIAAIWTAHKYKCNALILLSTFSDLRTVVDKMKAPESMKSMFNRIIHSKLMSNGKWIRHVDVPTIIIHSQNDDVLPYVNAQMNYDAVGSSVKKLITITGQHAHPNFTYDNMIALLKFIKIDEDVINDQNKIEGILEIVNTL